MHSYSVKYILIPNLLTNAFSTGIYDDDDILSFRIVKRIIRILFGRIKYHTFRVFPPNTHSSWVYLARRINR